MKELGEVRKRFFGDVTGNHVNIARKLLGAMKQQMRYGNLTQLARQVVYDGVVYRVESYHGQDVIAIVAPRIGGDPVNVATVEKVKEITSNNFIQLLYFSRENYMISTSLSLLAVAPWTTVNYLDVGAHHYGIVSGSGTASTTSDPVAKIPNIRHRELIDDPAGEGLTPVYPRFFFIKGFKEGPMWNLIPNEAKGEPVTKLGNTFVNFGEYGSSQNTVSSFSLPCYAPILLRDQWTYEGFGDEELYGKMPLTDFIVSRPVFRDVKTVVNWTGEMLEALKIIFATEGARDGESYPVGIRKHVIMDCLDGRVETTPSYMSNRAHSPGDDNYNDRKYSESADYEERIKAVWDAAGITKSHWYSSCGNGYGDLNKNGLDTYHPIETVEKFGGEYYQGSGSLYNIRVSEIEETGKKISEAVYASILAEAMALEGEQIVEKNYETEVRNGCQCI